MKVYPTKKNKTNAKVLLADLSIIDNMATAELSAKEKAMKNLESKMIVGKTYLIHVVPGWEIAGTVAECSDGLLSLTDAIYIEATTPSIFSVSSAKTAKELIAAAPTAHNIGSAMIRLEAVTIVVECARDMTPISRRGAADAIKGAAQ